MKAARDRWSSHNIGVQPGPKSGCRNMYTFTPLPRATPTPTAVVHTPRLPSHMQFVNSQSRRCC